MIPGPVPAKSARLSSEPQQQPPTMFHQLLVEEDMMTSTEAATVVGSQTTTSPYTTDQHTVRDFSNIQIITIFDQRVHLSSHSTMIMAG